MSKPGWNVNKQVSGLRLAKERYKGWIIIAGFKEKIFQKGKTLVIKSKVTFINKEDILLIPMSVANAQSYTTRHWGNRHFPSNSCENVDS